MGINDIDWLKTNTCADIEQEKTPYENGAKRASDIEEIRRLEKAGILGWEQCPEPEFWRWPVNKPDELPERFKKMYEACGEIRW